MPADIIVATSLPAAFEVAMAQLGPFEPKPRLAVAVSGGADSMALALLARDWAVKRGGTAQALIVDHGLRDGSAAEASLTAARVTAQGIPARILTLSSLKHGSAVAERARRARYSALRLACAQDGILHLLLGHHAADQAETVMIRVLGGSGSGGLAAMASLVERDGLRLLRPLLDVPPAPLRRFLTGRQVAWVEDPSNISPAARRSRLRRARADPAGDSTGTAALVAAVAVAARSRAGAEHRVAEELGRRVMMRPEGFAVLTPGAIDPLALSALIRTVGGTDYPPSPTVVADLARDPRPRTVSGVRLLSAGRLGPGLLIVREVAAIGLPVAAQPGMLWDNRFHVHAAAGLPSDLMIGPLGSAAAGVRDRSDLPAAVLQTLPALFRGNLLVAVPHLSYRDPTLCPDVRVVFQPPGPLAGAPFLPADGRLRIIDPAGDAVAAE